MENIVTEKQCTKCKEWKTTSDYNTGATTRDGLRPECKECQRRYSLTRYYARRDEIIQKGRAWYERNKEKVKVRHKEYRKKNADKIREWIRSWRKENPDKGKSYVHKYLDNNRDASNARSRAYKAKHKDKVHEHGNTRRARKKNAGGRITAKDWKDVLEKYGNRCLCCGRSDTKLHMDHVMPLAIGGSNTIDNIQPLCKSCNSRKFTKHIDYRKGV